MTEVLTNIYRYNIISYLYDETLKLIDDKNKSPRLVQRMELYCNYLRRMMYLDKINFSADVSLLIRNDGETKKEKYERKVFQLIEMLGRLMIELYDKLKKP